MHHADRERQGAARPVRHDRPNRYTSSLLLSSLELSGTKSMSLEYEPSSEPLHNAAKQLFLDRPNRSPAHHFRAPGCNVQIVKGRALHDQYVMTGRTGIHPKTRTANPTPSTLHPTPHTPSPTPYDFFARHPTPQIPNSKP